MRIKQYSVFVPCHYIVADKAGNSFIYENSTGRNVQHIIDGNGQPQVVTNFQVHKHPTPDQMPNEALTLETNALWRYQTLVDRISGHNGLLTPNARAGKQRRGEGVIMGIDAHALIKAQPLLLHSIPQPVFSIQVYPRHWSRARHNF